MTTPACPCSAQRRQLMFTLGVLSQAKGEQLDTELVRCAVQDWCFFSGSVMGKRTHMSPQAAAPCSKSRSYAKRPVCFVTHSTARAGAPVDKRAGGWVHGTWGWCEQRGDSQVHSEGRSARGGAGGRASRGAQAHQARRRCRSPGSGPPTGGGGGALHQGGEEGAAPSPYPHSTSARSSPYSDSLTKLRIGTMEISGGRSLAKPFRGARRFLLYTIVARTRMYTHDASVGDPSFKYPFLSPRPNPLRFATC